MIKELIIVFFFSLSPFLWLRGQEILIGHDSGVRLNFVENLRSYLYTWDPIANFGHNWSLYTGFLVSQFPETFFAWLFGSVARGEAFGFWFWFFAIGLSFYAFAKYFFSEKKYMPLRIIGPVFFMYNFYILNGWSIFERAKFSLYIALPLMIVIFFKTAQKEWSLLKGGILLGLLFFFFNGGGSPPLYGGIIVTYALLVVYFIFSGLRAYTARVIGLTVLFGAFFILFNLYWILPQARLLLGNYEGAISARGGIEGLISWERVISANASFFNILRFQGFPDWYNNSEHPYAHAYIYNKLLIFLSFIPMTVMGLGLLLNRLRAAGKSKKVLIFLLLLGATGLFFTMGSHPPFGAAYTFFMRYVPGFAIFRSSLYKFAPTVYLAVIVFFGYYLSEFLDRFRLSKVLQLTLVVIIAAGIALYHFPYFTGNFFRIKDGFSTRLTIPDYVKDMQKVLLAGTTQQDRILLVPPLDVGFIITPIDTYSWGFYGLDALPRIMVHRSFLANDSSDDSVTRLLYEAIVRGDDETFLRLAAKAGLTHILWRGDVRLSPGIQKNMPLSAWQEKLADLEPLRLKHESGPWRLYEVDGIAVNPMVYGDVAASFVNDAAVDDAYVVGAALAQDSGALLRVSGQGPTHLLIPKERYIEAECFLCKTNEYSKLVEAITLPLPKSSRLPFLKDRQTKQIEKTIAAVLGTPQEVDARLSAATLALSQKNMEPYRDHVRRIVEVLNILTGREKDYYANRVLAYLDAHIRDTEGQQDQVVITDFRKKIALLAWKAEGNTYRFGFTLPVEGIYSVWLYTPGVYNQSFTLDGKEYPPGKAVKLAPGYHRLLLTATNIENTADVIASPVFLRETLPAKEAAVSPGISFSQKNPTRYEVTVTDAAAPYVLVLNQRFDPGWGLSIDGIRQDYYHLQANGFANSWIVPKTGTYTLSLYYIPQQQANLGAIISGSTLLATLGYFVLSARKKRKS